MAAGRRLDGAARRLSGRPAVWAVLVGALAAWPLAWALRTPLPPPLPVLAEVPPFQLVDEAGHPFGSRELAGRVWVASFIFTRCRTVCPSITRTMARIQDRSRQLAPELHLVSLSVDPAWDTPERLAAYAAAHRASPRMWSFLTGPEAAVRAAVVGGLKIAVERGVASGDPGQLLHGTHLVLVDGAGRIRGYYDSTSSDVVDRVVRDAALLVNRGG